MGENGFYELVSLSDYVYICGLGLVGMGGFRRLSSFAPDPSLDPNRPRMTPSPLPLPLLHLSFFSDIGALLLLLRV